MNSRSRFWGCQQGRKKIDVFGKRHTNRSVRHPASSLWQKYLILNLRNSEQLASMPNLWTWSYDIGSYPCYPILEWVHNWYGHCNQGSWVCSLSAHVDHRHQTIQFVHLLFVEYITLPHIFQPEFIRNFRTLGVIFFGVFITVRG